jgi:hypothetical protein
LHPKIIKIARKTQSFSSGDEWAKLCVEEVLQMRACCPSQRKEFKCPKCGMEYNRDLNIARRLMMLCGMASLAFEPAASLNAGSSRL